MREIHFVFFAHAYEFKRALYFATQKLRKAEDGCEHQKASL
jgi:hypothetical protein